MARPYDSRTGNEDFNRRRQAQDNRMGNADPVLNPRQMPRRNEPDAGDRKARQDDRATNGGE